MLPHEKLQVYRKSLVFVAAMSALSTDWSKKHAVADQLERASESLILNLAEAARFQSGPNKLKGVEYAIASGLECAACLDIARIKGLLSISDTAQQKERLCEIVKMLTGLRKAWQSSKAQEDTTPYHAQQSALVPGHLFHHETLDVYSAALDLMAWLASLPGGKELSSRFYRRIDEGVTSIILNIAEGNGRYSELDHRRFLDIAETSTVKVAACLDLGVQNLTLSQAECDPGKRLLERVFAMLSRM